MITIIVPVYNSEKSIVKTIESILKQTYAEFELILINDGSTDKSGSVCDSYMLNDERVKVIHQSNKGASAARNNGIKRAAGKFVTFVDSDDVVGNNWLKEMVRSNVNDKYDLIISGYNKVILNNESNHRVTKPNLREYRNNVGDTVEKLIEEGLFNPLWNKLYKKQIIKKNRILMNEDFTLGEDFVFNLQYIIHCNQVLTIPYASYQYILNNSGLTHNYYDDKFEKLKQVTLIFKKFLIQNIMNLDLYYHRLFRNVFSSFMDISSKTNDSPFNDKISKIKKILEDNDVKDMIINYIPNNIQKKILMLFLRLNNAYILLIMSKTISFIKFKIKKE